MEKPNLLPRVAIAVLAVGVFLLDLVTPQGIAVPILYATLVPISLWSRSRGDVVLVAIGCTFLLVLGFVLSLSDAAMQPAASMQLVLSNRALGVLVIWAIAIVDLQRRRAEETVELLSELGALLQACLTAEEAYEVIARMAEKLFPGGEGSLLVISHSRNLLETVAQWRVTQPGESVFLPTDCWALRRGGIHLVEDTEVGTLCTHLPRPFPPAYMCVPLVAQGETLGLLHVSRSATIPLGRINAQLATMLAERIGMALANLYLRDALRSLSVRDPLTGLFNRRYLEESLEREVRRALRGKRTVGIIMVDLDHFKQFNDTLSHTGGDMLLKEVGQILQRSTRGSDIVCRYGGEEFTLILPDASLDSIRSRAEQLRTSIKQMEVQHDGQVVGPMTVSLGVALFPDHGTTGEAVLRAADAALYRAKAEGRDRLMIAQSTEEGLAQ